MAGPSAASQRLRARLAGHADEVAVLLTRYSATNLRLFGSVARGEAHEGSDLDLLVDLHPHAGNDLMRVAGLGEELSELLGVQVDVVSASLLRDEVSRSALSDAVAV